MTRTSASILFLASLGLSCAKPGDSRGAEPGRPPVAVETARAAAADLERSIEIVGALSARSEADVKSEVNGIVAEVHVSQWVKVRRGAPLASLDSREASAAVQAARAQLLQAEVAAERTRRELERTGRLQDAQAAPAQALDEARTADEAARAQAAAARAQLEMAETRLSKTVLRSPIDGVVSRRAVSVGDYVENMASAALFHVVDTRFLELVASVPSARVAELRAGQPMAFASDAAPGQEFRGKLAFVNPSADETSRTVKVKAEVANPDGALRPGLFVRGRIVTGTRAGALVLPRAALVTWDTASRTAAVFLVEQGLARRRTVRTGALAGEGVEVVEGLTAGAEVVTRGGFNLRDGDRVLKVGG